MGDVLEQAFRIPHVDAIAVHRVVTSVAGMLGFNDLYSCCANLLPVQPDDSTGFAAAAAAIAVAKAAASLRVIAMIKERASHVRVA